MKNLLILILFLVAGALSAQKRHHAFDVLSDTLIVPPNGIHLTGNIFMDDAEVMNLHYLEYLHFLAQDSSDKCLISAYPDTSVFGTKHLKTLLNQQQAYYKKKGKKHQAAGTLIHDEVVHPPSASHHWWNYFSYRGTKLHPVVGISYSQALSYCRWRSRLLTEYFNHHLKKKSKYRNLKEKEVIFEFSLPTAEIWAMGAAGGNDPEKFPFGYPEEIRDSSKFFNIKLSADSLHQETKREPQFIYSHHPNPAGFYNMIGNVSEMTNEEGISMGGSYVHKAAQCRIGSVVKYNRPQRWLGIRCVCRVIIRNRQVH